MKENFKILKGLPPYGEMYLSFPPNGYREYSQGLAVEFLKNDGTKWVGNFEAGYTDLQFACQLQNSNDIFIIAYGACFIVDPENPDSFIEFGTGYKQIFQHNSVFAIIDEYSISIVKSKNEIIHLDDLCSGEISKIELRGNEIAGVLNDYNSSGNNIETPFTFNLDSLEFQKSKNNNKWWKIW